MSIYRTEEEQLDAIKYWWHKNATKIIFVVILGLLLFFSWRYYNNYRFTLSEELSQLYENNIQLLDNKESIATKQILTFIENNKDTSYYAVLASLSLAKYFVEQKEQFEQAANQLRWAVTAAPDSLKPIVSLRLARLEGQLGNNMQALTLLDAISAASYQGLVEEAKGDIYVAQQDIPSAKTSYQKALSLADNINGQLIMIKLNDLPPTQINTSEVIDD